MGWKRPDIHLCNPRHAGTTLTCFGTAAPFAFRLLPERSLTAGGRGIARLGADYWDGSHLDGFKTPVYFIGMPGTFFFWPGPEGADSSIR
jgi:hypothetical protein